MIWRSIVGVTLLLLVVLMAVADVRCPEDNSGAYFTGRTRTSSAGFQLREYKCYGYGHLFWVRVRSTGDLPVVTL